KPDVWDAPKHVGLTPRRSPEPMNISRRLSLALAFWLGAASCAYAQNANNLLHLLPDDFGICIVMNDLRGHAARWEKSAWFKQFQQSTLGKSLLEAPELKQFEHWQ